MKATINTALSTSVDNRRYLYTFSRDGTALKCFWCMVGWAWQWDLCSQLFFYIVEAQSMLFICQLILFLWTFDPKWSRDINGSRRKVPGDALPVTPFFKSRNAQMHNQHVFPRQGLSLSLGKTIMSPRQDWERTNWLYPYDHMSRSTGSVFPASYVYMHKLWGLQHPCVMASSRPTLTTCVLLLMSHHDEACDFTLPFMVMK